MRITSRGSDCYHETGCDREETNLLALNLADGVARGKRGAEDARRAFARMAALAQSGKSSPYRQARLFC